MVCGGYDTFGEIFDKFLFYGEWGGVLGGDKAYTMTYAENMSVNRHCIASPNDGLHHVGRFTSYTREFNQIVQVVRYFAIEILHQHLSHSYEVFGLVVWV